MYLWSLFSLLNHTIYVYESNELYMFLLKKELRLLVFDIRTLYLNNKSFSISKSNEKYNLFASN